MNSKIKILLGVFFVFALLTPIYAGHLTQISVGTQSREVNSSRRIGDVSEISDDSAIPIKIDLREVDLSVIQTRVLTKKTSGYELISGNADTNANVTYVVKDNDNTVRKTGVCKRLFITPPNPRLPISGIGAIAMPNVAEEVKRTSFVSTTETNDPTTKIAKESFNQNEISSNRDVISSETIDDMELDAREIDTDLELRDIKKRNFTCKVDVSELEEGNYKITVTATKRLYKDNSKDVPLIVDRSAPFVTVVDPSTSTREPMLTGIVEDLTKITNFEIRVNGTSYTPTFTDGKIWEVQLNRLPRGTHTVWFSAIDELGHTTDGTIADAITIRSATGTGTRVRGTTTTPTVNPTPTPVTPAPQPVVTTPTVVNTPTPQPVVTTPTTPTPATSTEIAPTTGNVAVANPEKTSGTTGFLGLSENASTGIALLIGALLVIGALGYFLFFARDKKEKE
ncbi:MAG TPA: hypothetical protein P5530_00415 [Candidatus Diapherotrites archaeon]|nr:hypothetical protein [Candidatus Diapherotrites archaeon]